MKTVDNDDEKSHVVGDIRGERGNLATQGLTSRQNRAAPSTRGKWRPPARRHDVMAMYRFRGARYVTGTTHTHTHTHLAHTHTLGSQQVGDVLSVGGHLGPFALLLGDGHLGP